MHATSFRLIIQVLALVIVGISGSILCSLGLPESVVVVIVGIAVISRCNVSWVRDDMGRQLVVIA